MTDTAQIHSDQIAYWNGAGGARWVAQQAHTDVMLAPVATALIAHAAPGATEAVLDIGCGCGVTTLALAGRAAHVTGLDVSAPMLAVAERRGADIANIAWVLADAAVHAFSAGGYDLLFSRFGVMFFGDPVAAFTNLRRAARPGARLVFACWRPLAENPWMLVPLQAVLPHVPPMPPPVPDAPGPFAFADSGRVARILTDAGWTAPHFDKLDVGLDLAGGRGMAAALDQTRHVGATARALQDQPEAAIAAALADVESILLPYAQGSSVTLPGAVWLVSAHAG